MWEVDIDLQGVINFREKEEEKLASLFPGIDCHLINLKTGIALGVDKKNHLSDYRNFCKILFDKTSSLPKPIIICNNTGGIIAKNDLNSMFFNSSIWFWFLDVSDNNVNKQQQTEFISSAIKFNLVKDSIGKCIYDNPKAIEYFDYNLRIQGENYLSNFTRGGSNGHAEFITPIIYSNEVLCINKFQSGNKEHGSLKTREISLYHEITYNILVLDDDEDKCKRIKDLLDLPHKSTPFFSADAEDRTIWKEGSFTIIKFDYTAIDKFNQDIANSEDQTRLLLVSNIHDAIYLLNSDNLKMRIDLILMDYLLDKNAKGEREYASSFFKWFNQTEGVHLDLKNINENHEEILGNVKNYRGPLKKLWIFPITAFNQTFIDDLRSNGIRLIDYYWYLSRGADPINTPFLFISTLNNFLQLQLEHAVFSEHMIKTFLIKSIKNVENIQNLDEFNTYMAAEYTIFMERYMMRPVIARDKDAGSLFAAYVWKEFYGNEAHKDLFILTEYINKFYHRCAFGTKGDLEKMMNFWRELKSFMLDHFPGMAQSVKIDNFFALLKKISD